MKRSLRQWCGRVADPLELVNRRFNVHVPCVYVHAYVHARASSCLCTCTAPVQVAVSPWRGCACLASPHPLSCAACIVRKRAGQLTCTWMREVGACGPAVRWLVQGQGRGGDHTSGKSPKVGKKPWDFHPPKTTSSPPQNPSHSRRFLHMHPFVHV